MLRLGRYRTAVLDKITLCLPRAKLDAAAQVSHHRNRHEAELTLHAPDKRHPSLAGTYLASGGVFAALNGRSPVGNCYRAGIDEQTAKFLQTVAWETVQEYYGG